MNFLFTRENDDDYNLVIMETSPKDGSINPECKSGYKRVQGMVDKVLEDEWSIPIESSEKCGEKCNANSDCKSYQYSKYLRRCKLNTEKVPGLDKTDKDYIFCAGFTYITNAFYVGMNW